MELYEAEVRQVENSLRSRPQPGCPCVFYGSSSIRMWSSVAADLGSDRILNLAFGGSTLAACVHYFERLVPPARPCSLVLYAGDNDLAGGRSPEGVFDSFLLMADKVRAWLPQVPFGFISIKPSIARAGLMDRIRSANEYIREEIGYRRHAYYIDVFSHMLDQSGNPCPEFFLEDGLHLSRAGYELWARLLQPYRGRMLIE